MLRLGTFKLFSTVSVSALRRSITGIALNNMADPKPKRKPSPISNRIPKPIASATATATVTATATATTTATATATATAVTPALNFSTNALKAHHEPKNSQFVVQLGDAKAVLQYAETTPGVLDLYHTGVPQEMQGKGIGKVLAAEAFDYVVKNDLKMKLSCTYLQKYLQDNPKDDYKERVVEEDKKKSE